MKDEIGPWAVFWQKFSHSSAFIIIAFLGSVLTIVGFIGSKSFTPVIARAVFFTLEWLWFEVLSVSIPIWLCILIVSLVFALSRIRLRRKPKESVEDWTKKVIAQVPKYFRYTRDIVEQWTLEWGYLPNDRSMPPTILNLHPICPDCEEPLLPEKTTSMTPIEGMLCAVCHRRFPLFDENRDSGRIGIVIRHRIRTGKYQGPIQKMFQSE